jgi:hypothetical protein
MTRRRLVSDNVATQIKFEAARKASGNVAGADENYRRAYQAGLSLKSGKTRETLAGVIDNLSRQEKDAKSPELKAGSTIYIIGIMDGWNGVPPRVE